MRCHKSGVGLLPCCGERENYIGAQGDGQDNWQNVLAGGPKCAAIFEPRFVITLVEMWYRSWHRIDGWKWMMIRGSASECCSASNREQSSLSSHKTHPLEYFTTWRSYMYWNFTPRVSYTNHYYHWFSTLKCKLRFRGLQKLQKNFNYVECTCVCLSL